MENCVFCKIINGEFTTKKIYEDDIVMAIMDANPLVDGHVLIIPKKHITDFTEIDSETLVYMHDIAKKLTPVLLKKLNATSMTLMVNYGDAQTVKHLHLHLLPNYTIKEKSMEVEEVYELLKKDNQ